MSHFHSFLLGAFFLLVATKPLNSQSFDSLKKLVGFHKGQAAKGLHELKSYLEMFGYLSYVSHAHASDDEFDDVLEAAVKAYQSNYHLNVTGNLDSDTIREMMIPRCGITDIVNGSRTRGIEQGHKPNHLHTVSHYAFFPGMQKWPPSKTSLTYRFHSSASMVGLQVVRPVCRRAFDKWEAVSSFTFQEAPGNSKADIEIGVHSGFHGDIAPFDGPGGTVAHAFAPPVGWFHYDADENWSTNPTRSNEVDLESVAVHEIGHLLGLGHSLVQDAIMYPKFMPGTIKRNLHSDDIQGIRVLYS